jgi:hypothetical protein
MKISDYVLKILDEYPFSFFILKSPKVAFLHTYLAHFNHFINVCFISKKLEILKILSFNN